MSLNTNKITRKAVRSESARLAQQLTILEAAELTILARMLDVDVKRRIKGGAITPLNKVELLQGYDRL